MQKYLIATLLVFSATNASAQWVEIYKGNNAVQYIDRTSIKKNGNLGEAWVLGDRYKPDEDGILSVLYLTEFDCKDRRTRSLRYIAHNDHMARGRVIAKGPLNGVWKFIATGTVAELQLKFVCAE